MLSSLKMEWRNASWFANKLIEESSWSRTIYSYSKAAMLLQIVDINVYEKQQVDDLVKYVHEFEPQ